MRVRISDPRLLPDLVAAFLRSDCVAQPVGADTCDVVHVHARDTREASLEVTFFVRAWQARHRTVRAVVTP